MKKKIIAIMYDFDKTLCTKDMQEYSFIPNLKMTSNEFWHDVNEIRNDTKIDSILAYMYIMHKKMLEIDKPLKREYLEELGKDIELYPGLDDWFKRINDYGKSLGFVVEHYIISSGLKEIISGSSIGNEFKEIFASEYYYDNFGNAVWPKLAVNYTNKTQFLVRINKGVLDITDDNNLNKKMLEDDKRISNTNMIYIGDGLTDIPCMKLTKDGGGISIAVYTDKSKKDALELLNDDRINYAVRADYSKDKELENIIKKTISKMALNTELQNLTFSQKDND